MGAPAAIAQSYHTVGSGVSPAFVSPRGVIVDSSGNVFVSDTSSSVDGEPVSAFRKIAPTETGNPITPYSYAGASATYIAGTSASNSPFDTVEQITMDSGGTIYAADIGIIFGIGTVWKIAPPYTSAQSITGIANYYQSGAGDGSNGPGTPNGVAIDSAGNLFVTDSTNNTVTEFLAPNYTSSTQLYSSGNENSFFTGLAIDGSNNVYLTDAGLNTVQELTKSDNYNTIVTIASASDGLNFPNSLVVDPGGEVFVLNDETGDNDQLIKIAADHASTSVLAVPSGGFNDPNQIALDKSGNLFIGNTGDTTVVEAMLGVTVSSVSPTGGPSGGGTSLTITGTNFASGAQVAFGGSAATNVVFNSATSLTATAPAGSVGTVDVTATTKAGTSIASANDQFTYSNALSTSTTVTSSVNPATASQSETFTATVTSSSTVNDGTVSVTFQSGGSTISGCGAQPVSNGVATCITQLASGNHSNIAIFNGDSNFIGSTSTALIQAVNSAVSAAVSIPSAILDQGTAVSFQPITGGGGTGSLAYSVTPNLPNGLSLDPSSGFVGGTPTVTLATSTFTVTVTDQNNQPAANTFNLTVNPPVAAAQAIASEALTQNHLAGFTPVSGSGGTATLAYSVSPGLPTGLSINGSSGVISGTPSVTHAASNFTVTVTDNTGASAGNSFSLTVNSAVTATQSLATKVLTQSQPSTSFTPVAGGSGTPALSYSISPTLPGGLTLSASTGAISGSPTVTLAATTFTMTVTDQNGATATNTFSLTVNSAVTATQSVATKILTQSQATSFTPVTGGGGTTPFVYSISPTLPTGLSIDPSTGVLTGTPGVTQAATTFTVTVTGANSATATNTFSLTVNSAVTAAQSVATTLLTQNHAVTSFTPVTGSGGTGMLGYSLSPTLPAGLFFSSTTGAVTGNPSATSAATTYTVTVTDVNNATATNTFSLTVNSGVTATQSIASEVLTQSHAASFTPVTGGGGTVPLSYSVSPTLPTGLSIDPMTGIVSGTPRGTSTATTYTVTVADANNATAMATFSLAVNTAVTATQAVAAKTLTQNLAAAPFTPVTGGGGTTPISYSVSPALPAGLSLSSTTGAITGTPSVTSATTGYTVTVTDLNSATAMANFSLTVNPAVTATQSVAMTSIKAHQAATPFTPVTGTVAAQEPWSTASRRPCRPGSAWFRRPARSAARPRRPKPQPVTR